MKTVKILIIFLGALLFMSGAYAMNVDYIKTPDEKKTTKVSDSNTTYKFGENNRWNQDSYRKEYQQGVIRTH